MRNSTRVTNALQTFCLTVQSLSEASLNKPYELKIKMNIKQYNYRLKAYFDKDVHVRHYNLCSIQDEIVDT